MTLISRFGFKCGRDIEKFEGIGTRIGMTGVPVVTDNAVAFIEAEAAGKMDCGTHTIFLGQVVDCDMLAAAEPMTYAYYHAVKGGKTPKSAPTYQEQAPPKPAAWQVREGRQSATTLRMSFSPLHRFFLVSTSPKSSHLYFVMKTQY